jgi:hypothetical protein
VFHRVGVGHNTTFQIEDVSNCPTRVGVGYNIDTCEP